MSAATDARVMEAAILRSRNPREQTVYGEALYLVQHPETRVSTDADYPWWTPSMGCRPTPQGVVR